MGVSRRQFVRGSLVAGAALAASTPAAAQEEPDYDGWFDDVDNFDGTVDRRGEDSIEIAVGAEGNGGAFAYDPPAVMVSPGTEVVWEWTGEGGGHNVVSPEDGPLDSGDPVSEEGTTYSYVFEETGIYRYVCTPHESLGMKGAVVVREGGSGQEDGGGQTGPPANPDYGGWFDDVDNFDGETVDRTGQESVSVAVGAEGNGGAFAFDPPAVRVSPGTEVVWEWTGEGGGHNVVSPEDGPLDSGDPVSEEGTTYSYVFEETGIYRYVCTPHESLGMKGAVVVGAPPGEGGGEDAGGGGPPTTPSLPTSGAVLLAFFAPLLYAVVQRRRHRGVREPAGEDPYATVEEATEQEPANELGHDEYDPWGTAALVAFYFVLVALLWVFMYFVEFLGRVSVIG